MSSLIRSLKQDRLLGHKWLIIGVLSNRYDTSAPVLRYLSRAVWKVHKQFVRRLDSILMGVCDGKLLDAGRDLRLRRGSPVGLNHSECFRSAVRQSREDYLSFLWRLSRRIYSLLEIGHWNE